MKDDLTIKRRDIFDIIEHFVSLFQCFFHSLPSLGQTFPDF